MNLQDGTSLPAPSVPQNPSDSVAGSSATLRVVRGKPTDAELAALVAAVVMRAAAAVGPDGHPRNSWADPSRQLRPHLRPGSGGWRAFGLPH